MTLSKLFKKKDVYFKTGMEFERGYTSEEVAKAFSRGVKSTWRKFNYIYIFAAIFLIYLFSAIATFNWNLVTNILYSSVTVGIIAIGMGLIILTGEIDLSVGSSFAFIAGLSILSYNSILASVGDSITAMIITLIIALVLGLAIGLLNGLLIGKLKMPGFIVTLATMLIWRSLVQYILSIQEGHPSTFRLNGYGTDCWYWLGNEKIATISIVGIFFILIGIIVWAVMKYSKYGRKVYAVGSNAKAANLVGVSSSWIKVSVFAIAGLLIGFASFLQVAMRGSVDPSSTGQSFELYAIASVVLGGISMSGGRGNIIGVVFGTLAFQTIDKIIAALQLNPNLNDTIKGAILLVAVLLQVFKISKEDVNRVLIKYKLKFSPDMDLMLESEEKTKIEELTKKYNVKINKINANLDLNYENVSEKVNALLDERDKKIEVIKLKYARLIDDAKLKIELHNKKLEKQKEIDKLNYEIVNQKQYDKYILATKKAEFAPNILPYLEAKDRIVKDTNTFEISHTLRIYDIKKDFSLEKEQAKHRLERDKSYTLKKDPNDIYSNELNKINSELEKIEKEYNKVNSEIEKKYQKIVAENDKLLSEHKNDVIQKVKKVEKTEKENKKTSKKEFEEKKALEKEQEKKELDEQRNARLNKILKEREERENGKI